MTSVSRQVRSMSKKVKLVRVDKRLLHATVALNWNNFINASYIAIVDPTHKDDPFLEKVLQLSFSNKSKVSIFSVDQLLEFLAQDTEEKCNVMIIFKNICALREAVNKGFSSKEVQLPYPASRILLKKIDEYFTQEEMTAIREIQEKGVKFFFQTTPMDTKDYSDFNK